jgi:hypothetical protein
MLAAVGLNDQAKLVTNEVGNEWADRLLATELGSVELARAQDGPQFAFRIR